MDVPQPGAVSSDIFESRPVSFPVTVKEFVHNLPLFNPQCQAYHRRWKETDANLGEVRDLAVRCKKSDEDLAALDLYRSTMNRALGRVKQADLQQTIVEPLVAGGLCSLVITGVGAASGWFSSLGAGLGTVGCILAITAVSQALHVHSQFKGLRNDPNLALKKLPAEVHVRVGTLLSQKTAMQTVGTLISPAPAAASPTRSRGWCWAAWWCASAATGRPSPKGWTRRPRRGRRTSEVGVGMMPCPGLRALFRIYIGYTRRCLMETKIQKWGNSQGLRLSKDILELAGIAVGEPIEITVSRGEIILQKRRPKKSLDELLAAMPADYRTEEVDFGPPVGQEAW